MSLWLCDDHGLMGPMACCATARRIANMEPIEPVLPMAVYVEGGPTVYVARPVQFRSLRLVPASR